MSRILKKGWAIATVIFAASGLGLFHGKASANSCPSESFSEFLTLFSATPEAQQRLTATKVKALVLRPVKAADGFEPQTFKVASSAMGFPLMLPVFSDKSEGVEIEHVDDTHVNVVDKRAGNGNIKIYNFSRRTCWALEGIEDWSIRKKDLSASNKPGMSRTESYCLQRAKAYADLAGAGQYPLIGALFEAAQENYVCAAASGDPQASLDAASLSLSGMAPQLETAKVEALLKAAATTLADGAAALSTFYCYGNTSVADGECQHPVQAEKELIRAASMGSADATNYLGYVFEKGEWATKDLSRSMACYRLAAGKGNEIAAANFQRLNTQTVGITTASDCY